jgi:hypothetical protein
VPDENPLKELVAPAIDDIRVLLSSTAAFTAAKFAFISDALVAVPDTKVFGTVRADAVACEEVMKIAIMNTRLRPLPTIC